MSETLDEALRTRGYTHRKAVNSLNTGRHDIFLGKEFVGSMTAHEGWAFLTALREADTASTEELEAAADIFDHGQQTA